MKKININGVEFCDFGPNNYSCGMHLISRYPAGDLTQRVKRGEFFGVFLNPSAHDNEEFFGVWGTPEQYEVFYRRQRESQIAKRTIERGGLNMDYQTYKKLEKEIENTYKDWWEE